MLKALIISVTVVLGAVPMFGCGKAEATPRSGYVGIILGRDGEQLVIRGLVPKSPAALSNLSTNDTVVEVDGEAMRGLSVEEAVQNHFRGAAGTPVTVLVDRQGTRIAARLIRDPLPAHMSTN